MIDLAIILPVYNNEASIVKLYGLLNTSLKQLKINYHFVFVDDGSKDNSWTVLAQLQEKNEQISIFLNKENLGQHKTILNGFTKIKAKNYLVMDADLQDDPKYILELWEQMQNEVDSVFLKRFSQYQSYSKMTSSFMLKYIIQMLSGMPRRCGMYFIAKDKVVNKILQSNCKYPYISIMAFMLSSNIKYVEGIRQKREEGSSGYTTWKRLKVAYRALYCVGYLKFFN